MPPYVLGKDSIRNRTPILRHARWNGVSVPPEVAPYHRLFDRFSDVRTDYERSEGGEVKSHEEFTRPGDDVLIIGGGRGVTAVRAAQECRPDGSVTVYEASEEYADVIEKTITLNHVDEVCDVQRSLVGPGIAVYGDDESDDVPTLSPSELPECDVLEMDCEGAELDILQGLTIRPRILIVEVHPQRYARAAEVVDVLTDHGYTIERRRTNEGEKLTEEEFANVLDQCARGEAPAPVVGAIRE